MTEGTASIFREKILINANLENFTVGINNSILFKDDFLSFTIKGFSKYFIEKSFEKIEEDDKIYIFKSCEDLFEKDFIDLEYIEFELSNYSEILEQSGNLFISQEFSPEKGVESWSNKTVLRIKNIDQNNKIELDIINRGRYTSPPDKESFFVSENGARLKIDHVYDDSGERKVQSNIIKKVLKYKDYAIIELNYPLQKHIQKGNLKTQKILVDTHENPEYYDKKNKPFILLKNYLPSLDLHYDGLDDPFWDIFLRNLLLKVDKKIADLESKIKKLSN